MVKSIKFRDFGAYDLHAGVVWVENRLGYPQSCSDYPSRGSGTSAQVIGTKDDTWLNRPKHKDFADTYEAEKLVRGVS